MGISVTQLLIVLVIVIVLFGTKRLRNIGTDLGGAIRGFRSAVKDEDGKLKKQDDVIDAETKVDSKEETNT